MTISRKIITALTVALGLTLAGGAAPALADHAIIEPNYYTQNDRCGKKNDDFTIHLSPTGYHDQITLITQQADGTWRAGTMAYGGSTFPDGSTEIVTTFPAFTNVPCRGK